MPSSADEILAKISASVRKNQHTTASEQAQAKPPPVGTLRWAVAYARHGCRVFSVHHVRDNGYCSCGPACPIRTRGKHPRYKGWQADATTDETVIHRWWQAEPWSNIGIACGAGSDLTVLDVDGDEGRATLRELELEHGELPPTPMVITGSGGLHYYFQHVPGVPNEVRFAPGLDVRNDGGLVVGAGSKNANGEYRWEVGYELGALPLAEMPEWLVERIKGPNGDGKRERVTQLGAYPPVPVAQATQMLQCIDADNYNTWLQVGMALKAEYGVHGRPLWDSYSKRSAKYDPDGQDKKWASIDVEGGIGIGTVVKLAKEAGWVPAVADADPPLVLPFHDFDLAEQATEEYLRRIPVVEGLCYSSATSMITGGKHAGKSTLMRWLAICVAKGFPFLGRDVQQGPVIYCASEDEELPAMSELKRLGWCRNDPIIFLPKSKISDDMDEQAVLRVLADKIVETKAVMVAVDMLFDFIPVRDELGYAETRRATGLLQKVASVTGCHIVCVHHAPKHADKKAEVTITALGSMGLAARVSPMILVVRWAHGVHTVETSDVRDPRGRGVERMRLLQNGDGSMELGQHFKEYMLATSYADRVYETISEEIGQEFTVRDIMEVCNIESYETARATLKFLFDNGRVQRGGKPTKGKGGYRYFIPLTAPVEVDSPTPHVNRDHVGYNSADLEAQGRFGYKENDRGPEPEKMKPRNYSNLPTGDDDLDEFGISKSK